MNKCFKRYKKLCAVSLAAMSCVQTHTEGGKLASLMKNVKKTVTKTRVRCGKKRITKIKNKEKYKKRFVQRLTDLKPMTRDGLRSTAILLPKKGSAEETKQATNELESQQKSKKPTSIAKKLDSDSKESKIEKTEIMYEEKIKDELAKISGGSLPEINSKDLKAMALDIKRKLKNKENAIKIGARILQNEAPYLQGLIDLIESCENTCRKTKKELEDKDIKEIGIKYFSLFNCLTPYHPQYKLIEKKVDGWWNTLTRGEKKKLIKKLIQNIENSKNMIGTLKSAESDPELEKWTIKQICLTRFFELPMLEKVSETLIKSDLENVPLMVCLGVISILNSLID